MSGSVFLSSYSDDWWCLVMMEFFFKYRIVWLHLRFSNKSHLANKWKTINRDKNSLIFDLSVCVCVCRVHWILFAKIDSMLFGIVSYDVVVVSMYMNIFYIIWVYVLSSVRVWTMETGEHLGDVFPLAVNFPFFNVEQLKRNATEKKVLSPSFRILLLINLPPPPSSSFEQLLMAGHSSLENFSAMIDSAQTAHSQIEWTNNTHTAIKSRYFSIQLCDSGYLKA